MLDSGSMPGSRMLSSNFSYKKLALMVPEPEQGGSLISLCQPGGVCSWHLSACSLGRDFPRKDVCLRSRGGRRSNGDRKLGPCLWGVCIAGVIPGLSDSPAVAGGLLLL